LRYLRGVSQVCVFFEEPCMCWWVFLKRLEALSSLPYDNTKKTPVHFRGFFRSRS
jgi:hypothetical protein